MRYERFTWIACSLACSKMFITSKNIHLILITFHSEFVFFVDFLRCTL